MKRRGRTTARYGDAIPPGDARFGAVTDAETRIEALLRAGFPEEPLPAALEEAQLAAIVEAAGSLTTERAAGMPRSAAGRRRFRAPRLAAGLAAASAALLLLFSGLAAAGTLPSPLQGFASRAAGLVGVHVPPRPHASSPKGLATHSASARPTAEASSDAKPGAGAGSHRTSTPTPRGKSSQARSHSQGQRQHGTHRDKPAARAPSSSKGGPRPSSGLHRGAPQQSSGRIQKGGRPSPPRGNTKRAIAPKHAVPPKSDRSNK
jgi:hypothetical protein